MNQPFRPNANMTSGLTAAVNAAVGAASARSSIVGGSSLLVTVGAEPIHITFGGAAVVADATTGLRLPGNTVRVLGIPNGATHLAYIRETADSRISLIPGEGI
jgi:hypothetical protein